ncbi:ATP-grasp domain-containing protein [Prevotella brevis]|nr:ATP-grasp domain-containing protein [Xylanibacter brevis]
MKQQKLLMLGTSLLSKEMVEYAKSQGVYTIVTDYLEPEKSRAKLVSDEYWMINVAEVDLLEQKCREEGITAIICGISEFCLEVCMELCKRLNLPTYCTPEAWHFSRDKDDFKKLCIEVGAPIAKDYYLTDALTEEDLNSVEFPVVVKPVDMSGNRGISYCYNKNELVEAYKYARSVSKSDKIIVEKMLKGKEWYSNYAIVDGEIRLLTLNGMYAEPGHLKNLYSLTTTVSDNVERFCKEINPKIEEVLRKVGCKQGLAWVQVMLDEDDHFYIIEMGYRLPGDMTFIPYVEMFNLDVTKWLVDYSLGIKKPISEMPNNQTSAYKQCGCCYSLWTHKEGVIAEINGIEEILSNKGFGYYSLNQVGSHMAIHRPVGVITFTSDDIEEMIDKIKWVNETVTVKDTVGEDIYIRYTDFDYLRKIYQDGLEGK